MFVRAVTFLVCSLSLIQSYANPVYPSYEILHSFSGRPFDGATPNGTVILDSSGTTLYGMTSQGGVDNFGAVFSLPISGGTPQILHSFTPLPSDGLIPNGSLVLNNSGTILYGMTTAGGGTGAHGIVFSLPISGGALQILHSFTSAPADGATPNGSLILNSSGTTLYGMTSVGGASNLGVVFSLPISGGAPQILHSFTGAPSDGATPNGSLILNSSGTTLYGMTSVGGASNLGAIFSLPISGGAPQILHSFTGASSDGASPNGSLILNGSGTTLYGTTSLGGASNLGVVFSLPISGGALQILHSFTGAPSDGSRPAPYSSLVLNSSGTTLYGMTSQGGASNLGAIFSLPIAGGTPEIIHSFTGASSDGANPNGSLTLNSSGTTFYSMTRVGGANNSGIVFNLSIAPPPTPPAFFSPEEGMFRSTGPGGFRGNK